MFSRSRLYGLDIETDTSVDGLDPRLSRITEVVVAVGDGGEVFHCDDAERGTELSMLLQVDDFIRSLPAGLIVTWNGSFFDLPFITDRWAMLTAPMTISGGPTLHPDSGLVPKYEPLPGHAGGYNATWPISVGDAHAHLDIAPAYRKFAADRGVSWSLKPVARAMGLDPVELDREQMHTYTQAERDAYVLSDGLVTVDLAAQLLGC